MSDKPLPCIRFHPCCKQYGYIETYMRCLDLMKAFDTVLIRNFKTKKLFITHSSLQEILGLRNSPPETTRIVLESLRPVDLRSIYLQSQILYPSYFSSIQRKG